MSGRFDSCIGGHEAEAKRASRSVVPREPPPSNSLWARLLASGLEAGRAVIRSILLEFIDGPKERMTAPRDGFLPLPFKPAAVRWPRCASLLRYARFARRILCPAGFLVALVFSRSKNASSNSSLLQAGAHVRSGGLQAASPLGRAFRPGSLTAPPPVPQTARRERAAALQPEPLRTVFVYL